MSSAERGKGTPKTDGRRESVSAVSWQNASGPRSGGAEQCFPAPAPHANGTNTTSTGEWTTESALDNCHLLKQNGVTDRPGLESASCDCYLALAQVYEALGPDSPNK